ncbi:hypothetical protein [Dyella acidiphila]|uniref:ABC transporter permease n=1 Tax=Dyella acidiphila TaxID=2775866 RepID=A0ABR9GDL2_9GAMM|nr:hypothetical protein [Dyella acidiphila]MBE1162130.1 hypothetical protein [Dyella acidiphila]
MNAISICLVPWRTTAATQRWLMLAMLALVWIGSAVYAERGFGDGARWTGAILSGYANFLAGMILLAPTLLLAVDARQLRVPRMQHTVLPGLVLYGAMLAAIPTILLVMAGGEWLGVFAIQVMSLTIGFTLGMLPRYFAALLGFVPVLLNVFKLHFAPPHAGNSSFYDIVACVALLACVSALCWRRQLRAADPYQQNFGRPLVMQVGANRHGWPGWFVPRDSTRQLLSMPAWMQPVADVSRAGPARVAYSLQIALGGWLLPVTWQSRLMRWLLLLIPTPVIIYLGFASAGWSLRNMLHALLATFDVWVWLLGFVGASLSLVVMMVLQQRWRRDNAELALLALLPGLGNGRPLVWQLLRASMQRMLSIQAILLAILLAVALRERIDALSLCMAILSQLGSAAIVLACALCNFGGVRLPGWSVGVAAGVCYTLLGLDNAYMPLFTRATEPDTLPVLVLISAWIALILALATLAWHGWRGVQRRAHPFMPV